MAHVRRENQKSKNLIQVDSNVMIVMDSFALPVEGTETRVNAQAQAYEYMSQYTIFCEQIARKDKVIWDNSVFRLIFFLHIQTYGLTRTNKTTGLGCFFFHSSNPGETGVKTVKRTSVCVVSKTKT